MVSGTEIISSSNKTSYTGSYGLNAQWTVWNGGQRLNTIKQQKLNKETAELTVNEQENTLQEEITKLYVQILYADESVRINEGTLELSKAQYERGKELLAAGDISKSELAQLESQVSNDNYQLVTAQTSLENYKLQLKQLLELDGDREFTLAIPELDETNVLSPLPAKADIYNTALALRPEIQSSRLNIQSADLSISIPAQRQPDSRYRHQSHHRKRLYLLRTGETRMEQLHWTVRQLTHLQQPGNKKCCGESQDTTRKPATRPDQCTKGTLPHHRDHVARCLKCPTTVCSS